MEVKPSQKHNLTARSLRDTFRDIAILSRIALVSSITDCMRLTLLSIPGSRYSSLTSGNLRKWTDRASCSASEAGRKFRKDW